MGVMDGFAERYIAASDAGDAARRDDASRNALAKYAPDIYGGNSASRKKLLPVLAGESPELAQKLLPVFAQMDDNELSQAKAEMERKAALFYGVQDDAGLAQAIQAGQAQGLDMSSAPRSVGEAQATVRMAAGVKGLMEQAYKERQAQLAEQRYSLMERGQYGAPVTVMGPGGQPAFVQVNPQQGTARPVQLPKDYAPLPPASVQPNAPSGYRYTPDQTLEPIPGGPQDQTVKPPVMPSFAQKAEDQDVEALGTLAQGQTQLEKMFGDAQRANLGLLNNWQSYIGGFTGGGDQTQAYADLRQGLETFRNNVLMLHKGVQTEGDANRAMSQIVQNINNPEIVKSNLETLSQLNQRAYELKLGAINLRRERNRIPAFDPTSADLPPAIPARGRTVNPPRPPARPTAPPPRQLQPNRTPAPARPQSGPMQLPPNPAQLRQGAVYQTKRGPARYLGNGQFEAAQ